MSTPAIRRSTRLLSTTHVASTSNARATVALAQLYEEELTQLEDSPPSSPRPPKRARREKSRAKVAPEASSLIKEEHAEPSKTVKKGAKRRKAPFVEPVPTDFAPRTLSAWKVGPHVSSAGGVENSIVNAAKVGATAFALFLKSQRKWTSSSLPSDSVALFKARMKAFGYSPAHILPHGSYLVNLGNPDEDKREKSYACFLDDLKRCEELGLHLYNFHPGSTVGQATTEESLSLIAQCVNRAHKETECVVIVLENMAGSGNVIGSRFSELGGIIQQVEDKGRIGVCLDTCHMFAAGYDIRTKEGWNSTMAEFEREIGLKYLRGMHLNDSKVPLGSKKDRHENIGLGQLGLSTFALILSDPRTKDLPLILETPAFDTPGSGGGLGATGGMNVWKKEVEVLNQLAVSSEPGEQRFVGWKAEIAAVVKKASAAKDAKRKKNSKGESGASKRKRKRPGKKDEEDDEDDEEDADAGCDSCTEAEER